jgi:hypothetical protein
MWADSVGLDFFLARLSGVPAARFLFLVGGEVRRLAVGLSLGVALLVDLRLLPVLSFVLPGGCCARTTGCSTGSVLRFLPPNMAALFGPVIVARNSRQEEFGYTAHRALAQHRPKKHVFSLCH